MFQNNLLSFLRPSSIVRSVADKVSIALFVPNATEVADHVTYGSSENVDEFVVTVMGTPLVARFEFFKFVNQGKEILAGQYCFFQTVNGEEHRLATAVRMFAPSDVILPDGTHMSAGDLDVKTGMVTVLRDKLSMALLAEQVEKMSSWSFN
jgi:hypothetical protein